MGCRGDCTPLVQVHASKRSFDLEIARRSRQAVDKPIKRGRIETWVSEIVIMPTPQVLKTSMLGRAYVRKFFAIYQWSATCFPTAQEA
jgi:hypothetical protein